MHCCKNTVCFTIADIFTIKVKVRLAIGHRDNASDNIEVLGSITGQKQRITVIVDFPNVATLKTKVAAASFHILAG